MDKSKLQDVYALSPMQSGLLFQTIYAPQSDAYFVQTIFRIEGVIDFAALKLAWQKVSDHHPILRTGFMWEKLDSPMQYVLENVSIPFEEYDWRDLEEGEQNKKLADFIKNDRKKGFNIKKAPLFRLALIRRAENQYYLLWSQHHILLDGWCLSFVLNDVFQAYDNIISGKEVHFISRRPYREYIAWLQKQDLHKAESFWKMYLADLCGPTHLSFGDIIEKDNNKEYDTYSALLSAEETLAIKDFAKQHGLTLNTILQGAVGIILKHYTQQKEVMLGITISGRSIELSGVEEMVGLFINTLPLRINFNPNENVLSFLKALQEATLKINENGYPSLAQIQSWAQTNQNLFDVIFVFENYPFDEGSHTIAGDFKIIDVQGIEKTEYPLSIYVGLGKEVQLVLRYQTDHFNEELIKRLSDHIKVILKEMMLHFEKPPYLLPFLIPEEEQQILYNWNDTKVIYPEDKYLHVLFENQAEKTPNKLAVVSDNYSCTYQQLNEKSNQLAHYLRKIGVDHQTLVAISMPRSIEMVIGLFGVIKAGGAYVPLDPSHPKDRLQFMLEDSKASILLTHSHLIDHFKDYHGKIIELDAIQEAIGLESFSNLEPVSLPQSLVYVIYTSGSTGKPKGVMVHQKGLVNFLNCFTRELHITDSDKFLGITTLSFDIAGLEIYSPLLCGATLFLAHKELVIDPKRLTRYIKQHDITLMQATPSTWKILLENEWPEKQNLRLLCGGEAANPNLIKMLLNKVEKVWNLYGPTETTIWSSLKLYERNEAFHNTSIGRPIDNTQLYVLDKHLNPVAVGVPGEIHIGGTGVSHGYLNRSDLTADRFIPNPFVERDKENFALYRTGDLAKYHPNGNLEFLGRMDDQVKIRGFRIELGEVESVLLSHPNVAQAIVIAKEDESGDTGLVAYVVPKETSPFLSEVESNVSSSSGTPFSVYNSRGFSTLTEGLRNFLIQSLPDYMVPSFFVYINHIPLTPNGKVDRKSLLNADISINQTKELLYPLNHIQFSLAKIWKEILKVNNLSIDHNFFEIGGNSISAIRLASHIQKYFSKEIALAEIFKKPTIHALSLLLEKGNEKQNDSPIVPIRDEKEGIPLFMIHPGGGLAFCYMGLAPYIHSPIFGINNPSFEEPENGFGTIEELAAHYIQLIKEIRPRGPYSIGGWSFGGLVAFEISRQLMLQNEAVDHLILVDAYNPKNFDKIRSIIKKNNNNTNEREDDFLPEQIEKLDQKMSGLMKRNMQAETTKMEKYTPQTYDGKVVLMVAKDNYQLTDSQTIDHGWKKIIKNLQVLPIPGRHENLFDYEYIKTTAEAIKGIINN